MAKMAITIPAQDFRTEHAMAGIHVLAYSRFVCRGIKARPTTASIKFSSGLKQQLVTATAGVSTCAGLLPILARKWALSAFFAANPELVRSQFFTPLGIVVLFIISHKDFLDRSTS